jgi:hypothetical protein
MAEAADSLPPLRPPAVPLVAVDPYFSVWSFNDNLTDDRTKHWSGSNMVMSGLVRIDGRPLRIIGPGRLPAMPQASVEVLPTRTVYQFRDGGVLLTLTFTTPALPDDLDVFSWPVTYVTFDVASVDGKPHGVSLYFSVLADWACQNPDQKAVWSRCQLGDFTTLRAGSRDQNVLGVENTERSDWGYVYLAVPPAAGTREVIAPFDQCQGTFAGKGLLPAYDDLHTPRAVSDGWPALACVMDLGQVKEPVARHLVLACDDIFSVELFQRRLRPYWRRKHADIGALLRGALLDYESLLQRCRAFDEELMADLRRAGGERYARLCALSYRQCVAAHKLALEYDGTPRHFPKENYSGGFIGTVDVIYPSAPFFLLLNPHVLKAQLTPIFDYARSPHWPYPFAPHDIGNYPIANGQTYGGTDLPMSKQMPVEESGNMLILAAALAKIEGNADYAMRHWDLLQRWADYLLQKGLDPENQLCTDDFMGHLAHNANLSIKAIIGIGSFAQLCRMTGKTDEAAKYRRAAEEMARRWPELAADGDHYRLAFDKPGTWSQKYNLVWDKLLGLNLFPPEIARREVAYYRKQLLPYGLPLDSRGPLCKNDWAIWSATLAEEPADFEAIVETLYHFADAAAVRVPLTDCYWADKGTLRAFQARSVVGGFFIKLLADGPLWQNWARRGAAE